MASLVTYLLDGVLAVACIFVAFRELSELHGLRWIMSKRANETLAAFLEAPGREWTDFEETHAGHVGLVKRAKRHLPGRENPGVARLWSFLLWGWTAAVTSALACLLIPTLDHNVALGLRLALGILVAGLALTEIGSGIVKHLFMGPHQANLEGLAVKFARSNWWVARHRIDNLSILFLMLASETAVCFAALYSSMYAADMAQFAVNQQDPTILSWVYFSLTTFTTVGYGDIHPTSGWSELVTSVQLLSGPLALTWFLGEARGTPAADG